MQLYTTVNPGCRVLVLRDHDDPDDCYRLTFGAVEKGVWWLQRRTETGWEEVTGGSVRRVETATKSIWMAETDQGMTGHGAARWHAVLDAVQWQLGDCGWSYQ